MWVLYGNVYYCTESENYRPLCIFYKQVPISVLDLVLESEIKCSKSIKSYLSDLPRI